MLKGSGLRFAFLLLLLLQTLTAAAQTNMQDVVYLHNGSVLRGKITQIEPNVQVEIQMDGGSVMKVPMTDVKRITREAVQGGSNFSYQGQRLPVKATPYYPDSSLFSTLHLYFMTSNTLSIGLSYTLSYPWKSYCQPGLTLALDNWKSYANTFSVRASVQGDIYRSGFVSPYYMAEAGYGLAITGPRALEDEVRRGGFNAAGGLGCRFYGRDRAFFFLNLHYRFAQFSRDYTPLWSSIPLSEKAQFNRMCLGFGIGF